MSMVKHKPGNSHSQPMETNPPRNVDDDVARKPLESAWEKWCNAKYVASRSVPFDPTISGSYPTLRRENIYPTPISNFNFHCKHEIMMTIQQWSTWDKTQMSIYRNRVTWAYLILILTWGFIGNIEVWWTRVPE